MEQYIWLSSEGSIEGNEKVLTPGMVTLFHQFGFTLEKGLLKLRWRFLVWLQSHVSMNHP